MKYRKSRELLKRGRHKTKTKQSRLGNLKHGIEAGSAPPTTPPRNEMESVGVRNDFMSMRIQDLQRMERLISKHRRECGDLDANLEISNFSIRTRTVTFLCSCCKEELPFETSKVVTFRTAQSATVYFAEVYRNKDRLTLEFKNELNMIYIFLKYQSKRKQTML